jgi:RNA polymerase sigma-70 factor (ECF subfamily)
VNAEASDLSLVQRAQKGEAGAFDALVRRYQHKVVKLVMRYVRNQTEAEDIAQEAFIKAYRALPRFRGDSAFYTWLYRIAVNKASRALADMRRDPLVFESSLSADDDPTEGTFPVGSEPTMVDTPDAVLASRQIAQAVEQAVEQLSADLRQALLLRELEGLSYEEIAALVNCPVGTVRSRIFRARQTVAERLEPLLERRSGGRW